MSVHQNHHQTGLARLAQPAAYETPGGLEKNRSEFLVRLAAGLYPAMPAPVTAAVAAIKRMVEIESETAVGVESFCRAVVDDVLAGRKLPQDFAGDAAKAKEAGERQEAAQIATRSIREELDVRFPQVVADSLPGILAGLRTEVGEVIGRLPDLVSTLAGIDVASAAAAAQADAKQRAALVTVNDDCRRYNELRACQVAVLRAVTQDPHFYTQGQQRGALEPVWQAAREAGLLEFSDVRLQGNIAPSDELSRFLRLARRRDVWVPDLADVQDALAQLHATASVGVA